MKEGIIKMIAVGAIVASFFGIAAYEVNQRPQKVNRLIERARAAYAILGDGVMIESTVGVIEKNLSKAGVGYEVLDPTGQKTADQIKAEIKAVVDASQAKRPQASCSKGNASTCEVK
jgi:hypothetical protein